MYDSQPMFGRALLDLYAPMYDALLRLRCWVGAGYHRLDRR
jgi:hypothetical protein